MLIKPPFWHTNKTYDLSFPSDTGKIRPYPRKTYHPLRKKLNMLFGFCETAASPAYLYHKTDIMW